MVSFMHKLKFVIFSKKKCVNSFFLKLDDKFHWHTLLHYCKLYPRLIFTSCFQFVIRNEGKRRSWCGNPREIRNIGTFSSFKLLDDSISNQHNVFSSYCHNLYFEIIFQVQSIRSRWYSCTEVILGANSLPSSMHLNTSLFFLRILRIRIIWSERIVRMYTK